MSLVNFNKPKWSKEAKTKKGTGKKNTINPQNWVEL